MAETSSEALWSVAAAADRWLHDAAWPLWLEHGIDWTGGGFHEHLHPATLTCDADFRRLRVAARQTYAFGHAARAGVPRAAEAVELGLRAIRTDFALPAGGYATRCDVRGAVIDAGVDLYDQAFVLLALASAHALRPCQRLAEEAHALVRFLDTALRHPGGHGFREGEPDRRPRRQNPHMHLLEAFLAAGESFHDDRFFRRAGEMVDLFLDGLFQAGPGALPETFDDDWRPLTQAGCFRVEPGHHAEWIWLLARFTDLTGERRDRCRAASAALDRFLQRFGAGPLCDEVWSDGRVHAPGHSLWPQAEALKAEAARPNRNVDGLLRAYADLGRFLLPEPRGLWRERIGSTTGAVSYRGRMIRSGFDERGSPLLEGGGQGEVWSTSGEVTHLSPPLSFQERESRRGHEDRPDRPEAVSVARASSLYHLTGAITEASRRLSGGLPEVAGDPGDDGGPIS